MTKRDFTDLKIWQLADEIFDMFLKDFTRFPKNRIALSLADQAFRSIGSISANIAEGFGRGGDKELHRSLIIARGEIYESRNWLIKINKMGLITKERNDQYDQKFLYLSKMITLFLGEVRKRLK